MSEINYGKDLKKIYFEELDKRHADLKILLHADGIRQGEFFRLMVSGYLEKDERIISYVEEHRTKKNIQSKDKRTKTKKLRQVGKETTSKFALDKGEIESIFDLIAEEHPEL
tara:strand:- start:109 stop:444 length:336 start_codon:yes stop_codon:yes gene_type:complete